MNPPPAHSSSTRTAARLRVSRASGEALELSSFLALVASFACTDLGRRRAQALEPLADREALEIRRSRFQEVGRALGRGALVPSFDEPLAELVANVATGEELGGVEVKLVSRLLAATGQAAARIRALEPPAEALQMRLQQLPDLEPVRRRIDRTLDARGRVREDASPELRRLRLQIRRVRGHLYERMQGLVAKHEDHLSEGTLPMRGGRLVLVLQAGARGKLSGLVHGRSGSGKSFYFEPLEVVELNNDLQQGVEDEEAEVRRLLADLVAELRERRSELEAHAELLGELDLWQAAQRFAERATARLPRLSSDGSLRLVAARHPLLDPALAEVRDRALGRAGHREAFVPVDLELAPAARIVVITGPNAGGKTVSLKTAGLLALAAQCGLPVPASPETSLPVLEALAASVGDEQDVLADRSTFSGRLLRLKEAWELARPGALILIDELGSGTDPEEGTALATALLEELLAKGCLGVVTTHLTRLAAAALELDGAECAAMEFDAATGEPTFRLVAGTPGASEALSLARRLELPAGWIERAEGKLSTGHRDLRALLEAAETARRELAAARRRADQEAEETSKLRRRMDEELAALDEERRTLGRRLRAELEAFRAQVRERLDQELGRLREEAAKPAPKAVAKALGRLFAKAPVPPEGEAEGMAPPTVGDPVRHRGLGWEGRLEQLDGAGAVVAVAGKRLRCRAEDLEARSEAATARQRTRPRSGVSVPEPKPPAAAELHLRGWKVEPALEALDAFLDQALLGGRREVRVVHGHGTGRLREAVRGHLRDHPAVGALRPGEQGEGGNGVTVVRLAGAD